MKAHIVLYLVQYTWFPKIDATCLFEPFYPELQTVQQSRNAYEINLYKKILPFHSASRWQISWQTAGTVVWMTTYLSDWSKTEMFFYHLPKWDGRNYLLNICGWHHCGGFHHESLNVQIQDICSWCCSNYLAMNTMKMERWILWNIHHAHPYWE